MLLMMEPSRVYAYIFGGFLANILDDKAVIFSTSRHLSIRHRAPISRH